MGFFKSLTEFFFNKQKKIPEVSKVAKTRVLFILKQRNLPFYGNCGGVVSTGLFNSAKFVVDMLLRFPNVEPHFIDVIDNNCIDREVTAFKPNIVIIEALWCVPEKFDVLKQLHPKIKWVVRLHSELPFIAHEGIAIEWIKRYAERNVMIGVNSLRMLDEIGFLVGPEHVAYMPNAYSFANDKYKTRLIDRSSIINICCFGAIRPLKNQLIQALAAIKFASENELFLRFHVNGDRCENKGEGPIKNIRALFYDIPFELVEHTWMTHDDFLEVLKDMDISMQVSFSETFNIVTADSVNLGIPVLVSPEISWVNHKFWVDPTSSNDIVKGLNHVYIAGQLGKHKINHASLENFNEESAKAWKAFFDVE